MLEKFNIDKKYMCFLLPVVNPMFKNCFDSVYVSWKFFSLIFFLLGVYSEDYDPTMAHCNVTLWNPLGNNLSYEEFDFPIFSLKDDNDTQVIRQVNDDGIF